MSATPNIFGSLSADAYLSAGTIVLGTYEHVAPDADATPPGAPRQNSLVVGVAYNVDQAPIEQTISQPGGYEIPAEGPSYWVHGEDPYKNNGMAPGGQTFF
jgi:hypothetical protein